MPEAVILASQMKAELVDKFFAGVEVLQPKALNTPVETFVARVTGAQIADVDFRGKWIAVETDKGWLLLNLGMGGEILLVDRSTLPEKHRLVFDLSDGSSLAINFWWFGYAHWANHPSEHEMVGRLGPNATAVTAEDLREMVKGRRGGVKTFLLDQSQIAGIGNVYVQDILFRARLHPLRTLNSLSGAEVNTLASAIQDTLRESIELGSSAWEQDLHGRKGGYGEGRLLVGYREGKRCPVCGTIIQKIRTGSTSSYICPHCQPLG